MKNFCVNPFYAKASYTNDYDLPCCLVGPADDDYSREVIQQHFNKDIKSPYCHICWRDEANGITSRRQWDNRWISWHSGKDLDTLIEERHSPKLLSLQYKTSNLCNLACKTCYSIDSTRWYAEDSHYGKYNKVGVDVNDHNKVTDKDLSTLTFLEILGGEPFLDVHHLALLERLVQLENTNLHINYTTNGQQMPSKKLQNLLNKFDKVQINLSVDGLDKVFEYLRYPGSWKKLVEVMNELKQTKHKITCYTTLSNMNVFYFDTLLEWVYKNFAINDFRYQFVYDPKELAVNVMPTDLKNKITEKFVNHKFNAFLKPILKSIQSRTNTPLLEKFKDTISKQDSYRKLDPSNFVPEIVEYLY